MVVLDPDSVGSARIADFEAGIVKPTIAIEIGLNYGQLHLENDVAKLANSALDHAYVVHLARNPVHHHPGLVDALDGPSVRIAAALAGGSAPAYRLLQKSA